MASSKALAVQAQQPVAVEFEADLPGHEEAVDVDDEAAGLLDERTTHVVCRMFETVRSPISTPAILRVLVVAGVLLEERHDLVVGIDQRAESCP